MIRFSVNPSSGEYPFPGGARVMSGEHEVTNVTEVLFDEDGTEGYAQVIFVPNDEEGDPLHVFDADGVGRPAMLSFFGWVRLIDSNHDLVPSPNRFGLTDEADEFFEVHSPAGDV